MTFREWVCFALGAGLALTLYTAFVLTIAKFVHAGGCWRAGDEKPISDRGPSAETLARECALARDGILTKGICDARVESQTR
jgi:hypothetical protein